MQNSIITVRHVKKLRRLNRDVKNLYNVKVNDKLVYFSSIPLKIGSKKEYCNKICGTVIRVNRKTVTIKFQNNSYIFTTRINKNDCSVHNHFLLFHYIK